MMNKRAVSIGINAMIILALGLIVFFIFYSASTRGGAQLSNLENSVPTGRLNAQKSSCLLQGIAHVGTDTDGDGAPDHCDICKGGDDQKDGDGDGIPDACDKEDDTNAQTPNNNPIAECCDGTLNKNKCEGGKNRLLTPPEKIENTDTKIQCCPERTQAKDGQCIQ